MLLVRSVSGPANVLPGEEAEFRATSFNMSNPPPDELQKINWVIKSKGDTIAEFNEKGPALIFNVPDNISGQSILVMPFRSSPSEVVSVLSFVRDPDRDNIIGNGNLLILDRSDWGPNPDHPRRGEIVDPAIRTKVFIHHTVVVDSDSTKNEWEDIDEVKSQMRRLQTIRPDLGLDVPYSMVAFCMSNGDLVLGEGRGIHRSGAHTSGHNRTALGISFHGNFHDHPSPSNIESQLVALGGWLKELRLQQGFVNLGNERPSGREVFAHRDVKPTACPGDNLISKLNLIRFL